MTELADLRRRVDKRLAEYSFAARAAKEERAALTAAEGELAAAAHARQIIQAAAEAAQRSAHERVSGIVTEALKAVFGDSAYGFRLEFNRKRGKTEAVPVFYRGGHDYRPPFAVSNGQQEVAGLALRAAAVLLSVPRPAPLIVLDEALTKVSAGYRPRARAFVEGLAESLGVQFITVTHSPELAVGKVVKLGG